MSSEEPNTEGDPRGPEPTDVAREPGTEDFRSEAGLDGEPAAEAGEPEIVVEPPSVEEELRAECARLKDRWLRTAADFDNFKKRNRKEQADRVRQAEDRLLLDVLGVADDLNRALVHGNEGPPGAFLDGIHMVRKQLLSALERYGTKPFSTDGEHFDPELHEAIQQVHDERPAGMVCLEVRQGYRREGRLLRPAMVVVSLGPATSPVTGGSAPGDSTPREAGTDGALEQASSTEDGNADGAGR